MKQGRFTRRDFLKAGSAGLAVAAVPNWLVGQQSAAWTPEYRVLGRTGMKVTTVSMGCGSNSTEEVLAAAVDRGVNWLDTGHHYGGGRSEEMIGRVLKDRDVDVKICTKLPTSDPETMKSQIDISLQRLGRDHLDCLMIHAVRNREGVFHEDNLKVLQEAKEAGKARSIGFSTHRSMAECLEAAVEAEVYDVIITTYNIRAAPGRLAEAVTKAAAAGIGIVAMKTQLGDFPDPEGGLTPHQASLKWILEQPGIVCAVPAMQSFQQLEQNLAVMGQRLSYAEECELNRYGEATASLHCTDCGVCEDGCPHGVDVRDVRRCAMYLNGYREPALARETYRQVAANARPCADCAECAVRCSAGTQLQPLLSRAHSMLA